MVGLPFLRERNVMWTKEFFGMDVYHLLTIFMVYSIIGWVVESIYMSFCNKKLTNRGFAKGPFCPIYGFGALFGYIILRPLADNVVALYFTGAILATIFEYLVGIGMKKIFGEVWWDYNDKPFNYKGILCLESTIAWGFYAIIVVLFLHGAVINTIDKYPLLFHKNVVIGLYVIVLIDYVIQTCKALNINLRKKIADKYGEFKARWY